MEEGREQKGPGARFRGNKRNRWDGAFRPKRKDLKSSWKNPDQTDLNKRSSFFQKDWPEKKKGEERSEGTDGTKPLIERFQARKEIKQTEPARRGGRESAVEKML